MPANMTAREAALKCAEIAEQWRDGEVAAEHIRAFAATMSYAPIPAESDAARELLQEARTALLGGFWYSSATARYTLAGRIGALFAVAPQPAGKEKP